MITRRRLVAALFFFLWPLSLVAQESVAGIPSSGQSGVLAAARSTTVKNPDAKLWPPSTFFGVSVATCPLIVLTSPPLPDGTTGIPYNETITATGTTAPVVYSITEGLLPSGFSLSSDGVIFGTSTVAGTSGFTVTATDTNHCTGSETYTININCPSLSLSPALVPGALRGSSYSQLFTASGGFAPYSFSVSGGAIPAGLTLTNGGLLSGIPTVSGLSFFQITVTDLHNCATSRTYSIITQPAGCPAISITSPPPPNASIGIFYSNTYTSAGGGSPYSYFISGGSLPLGLSLSSAGTISGTPGAFGKSVFSVTVLDDSICPGNRIDSITVVCPTITAGPALLDTGVAGLSYKDTLNASGGTAPYSYAVTGGSLPPGLSISAGGVISGTPMATGAAPFTVTVTDHFGCTGVRGYTLEVVCPPLAISPATLPSGNVASLYHQILTAVGGRPPFAFSVATGALPVGLSLSPSGVIDGTPSAIETLAVSISVVDSFGCTGTREYTIRIDSQIVLSLNVPLAARWNMVSVPVQTAESTVTSIYLGPISNAYAYNSPGGYSSQTFMKPGPGYWLKFSTAHVQSVTGTIVKSATIPVSRGWNMIGSISQSIPISQVTSIPPRLVTSQFFGYSGSYVSSATLEPGNAYWVKVDSSGLLLLSSTSVLPSAAIIVAPGDELPPSAPEDERQKALPDRFALNQNFPNPFNPTTEITFDLAAPGFVTMKIYDVLGREINELVREEMQAGTHTVVWDARNATSGVYYCRLQQGSMSQVINMHLIR